FNKEVAIKQTVKAIDDKKVTLRIESTLEGKTMPGKDTQIPLEQFTDPLKSFAKEKGKLEKIDSGKETIEVGNKKVECEWKSYKTTSDFKGKTVETNLKIWISQEVPLNGLVRMESSFMEGKAKLELTGFGRGK